MARRRTLGRRLLWGIFGYVVTSLGALATTWLTSLEVSPLVGSLLATGVGLMLVVIGVLMDHAQEEGAEEPHPGRRTRPLPSPYQPPVRPPVPSRSIATVLVVILLLCGAGGSRSRMALNGPGSGRSPSSRSSPSRRRSASSRTPAWSGWAAPPATRRKGC